MRRKSSTHGIALQLCRRDFGAFFIIFRGKISLVKIIFASPHAEVKLFDSCFRGGEQHCYFFRRINMFILIFIIRIAAYITAATFMGRYTLIFVLIGEYIFALITKKNEIKFLEYMSILTAINIISLYTGLNKLMFITMLLVIAVDGHILRRYLAYIQARRRASREKAVRQKIINRKKVQNDIINSQINNYLADVERNSL